MLLLLISLVAGILTVLAPCVLPLLPIIIGGSLSSDLKRKARPYIIAISLAGSIFIFTLLLKVSTVLINLSPDVLTDISGGLVIALGLVSLFPELWEKLIIQLNWQSKADRFLGEGYKNKGKFIGPVLIGLALGPVFSSCSPTYAFILASVLPKDFVSGIFYLLAYCIGLVAALLVVSLAGRKYISRFRWAIDTHSLFRRFIGLLFIVIGIAIVSGQELKAEVWIANRLPFDETKIEQLLLTTQHKSIAPKIKNEAKGSVLNVQPTPEPALSGLTNWINSPPLTLSHLRGKVVLVDFWTYSCVNCNRALPYVKAWYKAYASKGLVVIGVHTPEFAFEHNPANVEAAVKADGITYPVALDNNYDTWNAFNNDSWPADYLIDKSGDIRYISLGEGNYNVTEEAIQELLGIHQKLQTPTSNVPITSSQSPETYFGTNRDSDYEGSPAYLTNGTTNFTATSAADLASNYWTINGNWQINSQYIQSESNNDTLTFDVNAKDVYVVAGSSNGQPVAVKVLLPSSVSGQYGNSAPGGTAEVSMSSLYHIVSLNQFGNTTVTLQVPKGTQLYTFTFGS